MKLRQPIEVLSQIVTLYWSVVDNIQRTFVFYADSGDIATAAFIILVFF